METITEDHVSFETAKLLKEKGFPQQRMEFAVTTRDCSFFVNGSQKVKECAGTKFPYYPYSKLFLYEEDWAVLPTLQMAMKWLREVHNLFIQICIIPHTTITMEQKYYFFTVHKNRRILEFRKDSPSDHYATYEQACDAAIKYCLENLI